MALVRVAAVAAMTAPAFFAGGVNGPSETTDTCIYDDNDDANGDGVCDDCFKECSGSHTFVDDDNNVCYFFVTEAAGMAAAEEHCQSHGVNVHVAFPPTFALFQGLQGVVSDLYGPCVSGNDQCVYWLGLNDVTSTCSFEPLDGSERTYSSWAYTEPNSCSITSSAGGGTLKKPCTKPFDSDPLWGIWGSECCVLVWEYGDIWNDQSCPDPQHYFCQVPRGDSDSDGFCDAVDGCVGSGFKDTDEDMICDGVDSCVTDALNDADSDGLCHAVDSCPGDPLNDEDSDNTCECAVNSFTDSDGDGICDEQESCPGDPLNDADGDGTCDGVDACLRDPENDAVGTCSSALACAFDYDDDLFGVGGNLIVSGGFEDLDTTTSFQYVRACSPDDSCFPHEHHCTQRGAYRRATLSATTDEEQKMCARAWCVLLRHACQFPCVAC
jgi:hypothetical protein